MSGAVSMGSDSMKSAIWSSPGSVWYVMAMVRYWLLRCVAAWYSISPSSTRYPCIFACWSMRP